MLKLLKVSGRVSVHGPRAPFRETLRSNVLDTGLRGGKGNSSDIDVSRIHENLIFVS